MNQDIQVKKRMTSYNVTIQEKSTSKEKNTCVNLTNEISDFGVQSTTQTIDNCDQIEELQRKIGSVLTASNITYSILEKTRSTCCKQKKKSILNGINVVLEPGLTAIMGPTGCGKTTLLDVLAGRVDPEHLSGTILLDGTCPPKNFKCMMGYVVQENTLFDTLTVRDNLNFSAALRFPQNMSRADRKEKVDNVIIELGLQHCADTKVGSDLSRGISGGEKKRCHIGMELMISPPVLFLDEPTTGLDTNTAKSVVQLLKSLSLAGRTIVLSIHQPRFSIYRLIDNIVLMSRGEVAYHGPAMECLDFFRNLGYVCEQHDNPADFIIDVINGENETCLNEQTTDEVNKTVPPVHEKVVLSYQVSEWNKRISEKINQNIRENATEAAKPSPINYATSPFMQFCHCSKRALVTRLRTPATFVAKIFTTIVMAAIIGGIYWQVDDSCKSGLQNRVGVFFFILTNTVFSNVSAVDLFISNRVHFLHETVSGYYRTSAYFLSAIVCDIALMRLIPQVFFSVITYFMIGLTINGNKFGIYLLTLFVTSVAAASISFLFSALVKTYAVANLLVSLIFMFMAVFSGLLVQLGSIPMALQWLKYISIFRYSLALLSINELRNAEFIQKDNNTTCATGNQYLQQQEISFTTDWDVWSNIVILLIITIAVLCLSYIRLRFMSRIQ